ncbi:MAG: beta-lactamase family protein [Rudaea sp.]|nr:MULTISPECIES: serine hydrolase domain-containing protein [unclassified Rudaea]MBN8885021.1 beta-lactamase family protein [Rudaea sp.]MBR0344424.1 beta-lactamase family protein [Rudaea sp.]
MKWIAAILIAFICQSCSLKDARHDGGIAAAHASFARAALLDAGVPKIIKARRIAGVGIAVIRAGQVAWTGYYGEQGPGVPATRTTMFNTASLAKSITAETTLRLVSQDKVSLDESIAAHYLEPDLANDPRYRRLTPRLILSHRSGLLNWEYQYKDEKLAFVADPGTRFGYSGAAYDILAKFLEKKLQTDFESIVKRTVFDPIGMTSVSMRRRASIDTRVTTPMNGNGVYEAAYTTTESDWHHGSWSSASDLFVSVDDYAKFLISVTNNEGLSRELAADRLRPSASFAGAPEWECIPDPSLTCPDRYGFGLGWIVFDYGTKKIVWGGGNDSGENAMVYFSPDNPGDAVILFINGGNGVFASLDIMDLIADRPELAAYIRQLIERHTHAQAPH